MRLFLWAVGLWDDDIYTLPFLHVIDNAVRRNIPNGCKDKVGRSSLLKNSRKIGCANR